MIVMTCSTRRRVRQVFLLILVMSSGGIAAGQTRQLLGTWVLNGSKSVMAGPLPSRQVVTFQPSGPTGVAGTEDTAYADGTRTTVTYVAAIDGRDYPVSGPAALLAQIDTVSLTRVDGSRITWTYKKGGVLVLTLPGSLSRDGRTLTMIAPDKQVLVYEKE